MDTIEQHDDPLGSDEAQAAVAAIVERAEERAQQKQEQEEHEPGPPKGPFLARPPVVFALSALFVASVGVNAWIYTRPGPPPPVEEVEALRTMTLAATAMQVESFQAAHGRLPESLAEAGVPLGDVTYLVTGDRYILEARSESGIRVYRSEDDATALMMHTDARGEGR